MTFYCTADGTGPQPPRDWTADAAAAQQADGNDESAPAMAAINAERIATVSHVVRNGRQPRTLADARPSLNVIDLGDSTDEHGGRLASVAGEQLRCPECLAPVRAVES